jgi:1-aminocyclopropane-1-carboxylate deaminase/D-cysteine desulfhydrase-like pyridoxal-dependent ACC family enzyme
VLSPQEPGPFAPRTLLAHAGIGSVIHLVEGWDGTRAAVEAIRELRERDGIEPYVIPMGGTNALGAVGYVNAALELLGQGVVPSAVYVAGGTLGTAIGLAIGFAAAGVDTHVQAVRVTPEEVAASDRADKLTAETTSLLHSLDARFPQLTADDLRFTLRHDWFEPGYGIPTPETTDAVATAEGSGLHLETTYTGKAFAALLADLDSGAAGDGVVFWNTYNSAPYPAPGPIDVLPKVLQDYIALCEEQFGKLEG